MDKTLLRPMFRQRYLETQKKVKVFKEGGIVQNVKHFQNGGLSSTEKALYAATLAAPLLQGTKQPGQSLFSSTLSDFGKGVEKLPATMVAIAKNKSKSVKTLSPAEVKNLNLPEGSVVQQKADGTYNVVSKPSAEQIKTMQGSNRVRTILSRIADDYVKLDKPVGPISYRTIAPLTKAFGSGYAKDFATMKSRIQQATSFVTQAISGAAVSEQEAERIKGLIPQLSDTEATFEAKLEALDSYFADAIAIAKNNNADFTTAMEIMEASNQGAGNYLDLTEEVVVTKTEGGYDVSKN